MIARIDAAEADGDTVGGVVEVLALGAPVGLGWAVSWDRKLDGRVAQAVVSIAAVKGVELGLGFEAARRKGSEVHDEILPGLARATNRAGGTEGGMTTGEPLVLRVAMKPISTLMSPLKTVDLKTGSPAQAQSERSDVTAVPAMGVIADRKSTRLNSSHGYISYAVFCLKKKKSNNTMMDDGSVVYCSVHLDDQPHVVPNSADIVSARFFQSPPDALPFAAVIDPALLRRS